MKSPEYVAHVRQQILAFSQHLRCDGISVPYVNLGTVDQRTTEAIRLVNQARNLLLLAADELGTR